MSTRLLTLLIKLFSFIVDINQPIFVCGRCSLKWWDKKTVSMVNLSNRSGQTEKKLPKKCFHCYETETANLMSQCFNDSWSGMNHFQRQAALYFEKK